MGGRGARVKGFGFERDVVNAFKEAGLDAKRFWGSDGRSAGYPEVADVLAVDRLYQCKRLKKLPVLLNIPPEIGGMICRADNAEAVAVVPLAFLIATLKELNDRKN